MLSACATKRPAPENPEHADQEVLVFYDRHDQERYAKAVEAVSVYRRQGWRAYLVVIEPHDEVKISNTVLASSSATEGGSFVTPIETFVFGEAPLEGWLVLYSSSLPGPRSVISSSRVETDAHWAKVRLEPPRLYDGDMALAWSNAPPEDTAR